MNIFNYPENIIFGKKHLQSVEFDKKKYDFVSVVEKLFKTKLCKLHSQIDNYAWDGEDTTGMDSHTKLHRIFYNKLDNGWDELKKLYEKFAIEVVLPYLGLNEALLQVYPNFRIQFPENKAITNPHYDSKPPFNHPYGEINFIIALTDMFDTNTIWTEKTCRRRDFIPLTQKAGNCMSFGGNTHTHFNKLNKTGVTRSSFDFRILPLNYYHPNSELESVTTNKKYIEGGYYKRIKQNIYN